MTRFFCLSLSLVLASGFAVDAQQKALPNRFTNSLGMEFVVVPKGKSWLGGGGGDVGKKEVNFAHDFYLGKYEVTQEEWHKVTGKNPSLFSRGGKGADVVKSIADVDLKRFPVENISWDDAMNFVKLMNEKLKKEAGWEYRLPTAQQWEYACRGGPMANKKESAFDFYFEKPFPLLETDRANRVGNGLKRTCKVGSYVPNRLGLYDMHGNVREWCEDKLPDMHRAGRGGSWADTPLNCAANSGDDFLWLPSDRRSDYGLRLARVPSKRK